MTNIWQLAVTMDRGGVSLEYAYIVKHCCFIYKIYINIHLRVTMCKIESQIGHLSAVLYEQIVIVVARSVEFLYY